MLDGFVMWPEADAKRYKDQGYWQGVTLGERFRAQAQLTPHGIALIDAERRWTFNEIDQRADRLAAGLHQRGLHRGDRVVVQLPNIGEFLTLCLGLLRIGCIPVLALPAHRESELTHLSNLSESVAYFIADRHLGFDYRILAREVVAKAPSIRHVYVVGESQEFISLNDVDAPPEDLMGPEPGDVALLLLSGGTTGVPKLIPRTHDEYGYVATASSKLLGISASTRYLAVLPVSHNFPLDCPGMFGTLFAGGTVIMSPEPSPDTAFELIQKERVTHTALIPPLVLVWLEAASETENDLSSLQWLQVGGSRLKAETAMRVARELGCKLQQVYGMAEGLICCTREDDELDAVCETQGIPLAPDDDVRIVDPLDRDVSPGDIGELLVRGPYTIRGYYRANETNTRSFTADGYYRSGDLVRRTREGRLIVEGRNKDIINRAGEKIPVEEVENLLLSHPGIKDAVLVGIPDETLGERSCACIIATEPPPLLSDLRAHLTRQGIAAFKLPDQIHRFSSFPLTKLGKVHRQNLAQQAAELEKARS